MVAEPDIAGGTHLLQRRRLGSGDGRRSRRRMNTSSKCSDEVGLASALNSAAMDHTASISTDHSMQIEQCNHRTRLISSPPNNKFATIQHGSSKKNSHERRRVSFSGSVSVLEQANPQDQTTRIISLPWRVNDGSRDIEGRYTGDINLSFQPHGRGVLRFVEGNITGQWRNGELVQQKHTTKPSYRRSNSVPELLTQDRRDEHDRSYSSQNSDTTTLSTEPAVRTTSLANIGYVLGDAVAGDHHMVIPKTVAEALQNASTLNALDFAFVLRSNGSWTYAIVAERTFHKDLGLVLRFVLDKKGTTKTIRRKYWEKGVRLVNSASFNELKTTKN